MGVSPTDIFACEISNGIFGNYYDSPYHGDYPMSTYQRISPDGRLIFNGSGAMFVCRIGKTGDMAYCGTLGQSFAAICFDLPHDCFYSAKDKMLTVYSYSDKKALNSLSFADNVIGMGYVDGKIAAVFKNVSVNCYTKLLQPATLLNAIKIDNTLVSGFSPFLHEYNISLAAAGVQSIDVTATAFDPETEVIV